MGIRIGILKINVIKGNYLFVTGNPIDNEYCNITKMDFVNITLAPLKLLKVFKFTINSHSIII